LNDFTKFGRQIICNIDVNSRILPERNLFDPSAWISDSIDGGNFRVL
jgi:hypothetical protein